MVTDIGQDRLDDGSERGEAGNAKRERAEPLPKLCEECRRSSPRGALSCPSCGAEIRAKTHIEAVDGELVELGSRRSGKREPEVWQKRRFFSELLSLRKPHHKPHWADAMFKAEVRTLAERLRAHPDGADAGDAQLGQIAPDRLCQEPEDGADAPAQLHF